MRLLEDIGPYGDMVVTTRRSDVDCKSDSDPGICHVLIGLLLFCPAVLVGMFMGLFIWDNSGLIFVIGLVALGFWACARYGTSNRAVKFHRRIKLSDKDKMNIERRLWDGTIKRRLSGKGIKSG